MPRKSRLICSNYFLIYHYMGKKHHKNKSLERRLNKVEAEMKKDKPEVKTIDILLNPLTATGVQSISSWGIWNGVGYGNYDLTRGFIQGLQNTGGNIDGNYCKLTSMDLRVLFQYPADTAGPAYRKIRFIIVRTPDGTLLTPEGVKNQVLEYGEPQTYGDLTTVSPLKRNTTINGGYDVMYDRVHILTCPGVSGAASNTNNPEKSTKYIHFHKKWKKGLTLRFSGVANNLLLEQNRIHLFAMGSDYQGIVTSAPVASSINISFISRIRYSDE